MKLDKKSYVKQAENVIRNHQNDKNERRIKKTITTTQIRNLLAMTNELYNAVQRDKSEKLSDEIISRTQYIKMRIAYNAGKSKDVKGFVMQSEILKYLDGVGDSRAELILVCHYMEALAAYHKYYIGINETNEKG